MTTPTIYVVCESADGWSLHEPYATDEAIAMGLAPPLVSGPWKDDHHTVPTWAYALADWVAAGAKMTPVYYGTAAEQYEYRAAHGRHPEIIGWCVEYAGKAYDVLEPNPKTASADLVALIQTAAAAGVEL